MKVFKKLIPLFLLAGLIVTLPLTMRGIAYGLLHWTLRDTPSHHIALGPCKVSLEGIRFQNVQVEWNENRFSCDEIEVKIPGFKDKGYFHFPIILQHPELILSDEASCQKGFLASIGLLLKLDLFVNHGVLEIANSPSTLVKLEETSDHLLRAEKKGGFHRYYFWSEFVNPSEKIFFFDRNPLPQGEAIASLLIRHIASKVDQYELRIDNLDGSTLLSLVGEQLGNPQITIRSANEGIVSLRAGATLNGNKANHALSNVNIEMEGIYALLSHREGVVRADEWNARASIDELPFDLEKLSLASVTGGLELRGMEIHDDYYSKYLEKGELHLSLEHGLLSGRLLGLLYQGGGNYQFEALGTADLIQKGMEITLNLESPEGSRSQMEIGAEYAKNWEGMVSFRDFPIDLLTTSVASALQPAMNPELNMGSNTTKALFHLLSLPIEGKLTGYFQGSKQNEFQIKEADLELFSFSILGKKNAWKIACPKTHLTFQKQNKTDLSLKTQAIALEWKGEKIGEAQLQLVQNPMTKLSGFLEGNIAGKQMSLSWMGEKNKGIFSFDSTRLLDRTSDEMPNGISGGILDSKLARLLNGLEIKGSWNGEKDRLSIELEKIFDLGHAELIFFEDGTGGFYFEKLPVKDLFPLLLPKVTNCAGIDGLVRASGQWDQNNLESSIELDNFTCRDFSFASLQNPKLEEQLKPLTASAKEIKIEGKFDFGRKELTFQSEPMQLEVTHPFAMQKILLSSELLGTTDLLIFRDLKVKSEWGELQGKGQFSLAGENGNGEMKLELGKGELLFENAASSHPLQTFLQDTLTNIKLQSASIAIVESGLQMRLFENAKSSKWDYDYIFTGHLDLPNIHYKDLELEEIEGEFLINPEKVSFVEGRGSFDLPNGKKVRCEELFFHLAKEKKEFFSKIDLGDLSFMNLHLNFASKEDGWQLHSNKSTILDRPFEFFAIGKEDIVQKWSLTTAIDEAVAKQFFKNTPLLQTHPIFTKDINVEIACDLGKPEHFKGTLLDMNLFGEVSSTSCSFILEKEDFHFDTFLNWLNKNIQGKGSYITPQHKATFDVGYNIEKEEGAMKLDGNIFATKIGTAPLQLKYGVYLLKEIGSSWKAKVQEFDGMWNEYTLSLIEPAPCQFVTGGANCNGSFALLKNKAPLAQGNFALKKNILDASLDLDLPKLHLCKNIDFLNPTKMHFEGDIQKLSEIDITCSDVEVYLVDLKEKITLCNSEIVFSLNKEDPVQLKSILKTSYNPFDFTLKIDPKLAGSPLELNITDKVTGEHLTGGFIWDNKGFVPQYLHGNLLGNYIEGKKNGEKFIVSFRAPLINPILSKTFPSYALLEKNPLFIKGVLEVQGTVIHERDKDEGIVFLGNAELKGFDLKNAPDGRVLASLQYRNHELLLSDLQTSKMPFELFVRKSSILFDQDDVKFKIPSVRIKNFVPSELVSSKTQTPTKSTWNLTHVSLIDFTGVISDPKSWRGKGTAHFANVQKGNLTFTKSFSVALEQMGLSSSNLRPAVGDVDFSLEKGKILLSDLRGCFSEGGATTFALSPHSRHFVHFDGSLHVELEPKPLQGLPWTEHVRLKIKGNVEQPEYQVR